VPRPGRLEPYGIAETLVNFSAEIMAHRRRPEYRHRDDTIQCLPLLISCAA
jgi:hypothetical protein